MKAKALTVHWHLENQPIYSAHFQPGGNRLATGGGDNNVRIWRLEYDSTGTDIETVSYLSTLSRHTQAVNAVRFDPKGTVLASAGDDGTILLWTKHDGPPTKELGDDGTTEDRESWKLRHACRASVSEIYDIAWSPDSQYIIAGSMDNVARVYNATNGQCIRQLAEHSHYVQGVAWDPLNEFIATQSSDRSVHVYTLKSKDGQFTLSNHQKIARTELHSRRLTTNTANSGGGNSNNNAGGSGTSNSSSSAIVVGHQSPAASGPSPDSSTDIGTPRHSRQRSNSRDAFSAIDASSPGASTPRSTPMNPPPPIVPASRTHSRKSSFSSQLNRSESPSPSIPLPAVMQLGSPSLGGSVASPLIGKGIMSYHNEAFTSFFRRLTFAPDGSLLFTPSGLYKYQESASEETTNTVYVYTRAGLNRPPVAHLPGLKKPSVAVNCSPVVYALRERPHAHHTKHLHIDPQPVPEMKLPDTVEQQQQQPNQDDKTTTSAAARGGLDSPVFNLPYRILYAVATQDSVIVYDTQQTTPLCIVSNLHYATYTDLTWSPDGSTLLMTSTDGFSSVIVFNKGELGDAYEGPLATPTAVPAASTPGSAGGGGGGVSGGSGGGGGGGGFFAKPTSTPVSAPTPPPLAAASMASPISTVESPAPETLIPVVSHLPPVIIGGQSSLTPPETPGSIKRAGSAAVEEDDGKKKRRIAPTLVQPVEPQADDNHKQSPHPPAQIPPAHQAQAPSQAPAQDLGDQSEPKQQSQPQSQPQSAPAPSSASDLSESSQLESSK